MRLTHTFALMFALAVMLPMTLSAACASPPSDDKFRGTALTADAKATDFLLTDQFGEPTSLQDFAGEVTLLTFLYTDCAEVCPVVANQLQEAADLLAEDASDAAIVIVSVDPDGDSVDAAYEYSERWRMTDRWRYLVGDETELRRVWTAYYIDPYLHGPGRSKSEGVTSANGAAVRQSGKAGTSALAAESQRIIHSAPIYLIDGDGVMRVVFTQPLEPEDLAHDARLLRG